MLRFLTIFVWLAMTSAAFSAPLRIEITDGVIEPLPFAAPTFIAETPSAGDLSRDLAAVVLRIWWVLGCFVKFPKARLSRR